jgi:cell division protein FtsN
MRHAAVYEEEAELPDNGAELSLGMGTLIGIFFGLALVCGVFFGFGYVLGHRPPGPYVSSEPLYVAPKAAQAPVAPKPSALVPEQPADTSRVVLPATTQADVPSTPATYPAVVKEAAPPQKLPPAPVEASKINVVQRPATSPAAAPATTQVTAPPQGNIMVQIAAVKSRPDAEALANALGKNGFSPTIRTESQDKLLHVQLGPFANRDDAKAMRQKLSSAGYDAFIK